MDHRDTEALTRETLEIETMRVNSSLSTNSQETLLGEPRNTGTEKERDHRFTSQGPGRGDFRQ